MWHLGVGKAGCGLPNVAGVVVECIELHRACSEFVELDVASCIRRAQDYAIMLRELFPLRMSLWFSPNLFFLFLSVLFFE